MGKGPWPAARVPAAGSPGPWRSTAAGWGEVPAWGCASRSGISPHCPLAAEGLCWGDRGTEAEAMGSPASCPFSSMLARSGDGEWRGGKVDEGGKSLRGGCGLGVGGGCGHLLLLLNLLNLFSARWAVGGCKTGAEHLSSGPELQGSGARPGGGSDSESQSEKCEGVADLSS